MLLFTASVVHNGERNRVRKTCITNDDDQSGYTGPNVHIQNQNCTLSNNTDTLEFLALWFSNYDNRRHPRKAHWVAREGEWAVGYLWDWVHWVGGFYWLCGRDILTPVTQHWPERWDLFWEGGCDGHRRMRPQVRRVGWDGQHLRGWLPVPNAVEPCSYM